MVRSDTGMRYTILFADAENLVKYHEGEPDVVAFDVERKEYGFHPVLCAWLPKDRTERAISKLRVVLAPIWHLENMSRRFGGLCLPSFDGPMDRDGSLPVQDTPSQF